MKSLLYQEDSPFELPSICTPCRQEVKVTIRKDGRLYHFTARDKVVVEDPYLLMVKAQAFSISESEPYSAQVTPRNVRDFLIRTNVLI